MADDEGGNDDDDDGEDEEAALARISNYTVRTYNRVYANKTSLVRANI